MSRLGINTGITANDGLGDPLRIAMGKINSNFLELYNTFGDGFSLSSYTNTSGISSLAQNLTGNPRISVSGILNTGITTTEHLEVRNITSIGIITAVQFVGDGSQLSNVTATFPGIDVLDDNVRRGIARELNFGERIITTGPDPIGRVTISVDTYVPFSGISSYATNSGTSIISGYASSCGISSSLRFSNVSIAATSNTLTIGIGSTSLRFTSSGILTSSGTLELNSSQNTIYSSRILLSDYNTPLDLLKYNGRVTITTTDDENDLTSKWTFAEYGVLEFPDGTEQFTAFTGYAETSGISSISERLTENANINAGIVTANQFFGNGSGLTGIVATGTGIGIKDNQILVGTATTIDFGQNLSVSVSSGIATINSSNNVSYAQSSGISTVSGGLTGTPNISVGVITATKVSVASSITTESIFVTNLYGKVQTIFSTSPTIDLSGEGSITGRIIRISSNQQSTIILPEKQATIGLEIIIKNFGTNDLNVVDYESTIFDIIPFGDHFSFVNDGFNWLVN